MSDSDQCSDDQRASVKSKRRSKIVHQTDTPILKSRNRSRSPKDSRKRHSRDHNHDSESQRRSSRKRSKSRSPKRRQSSRSPRRHSSRNSDKKADPGKSNSSDTKVKQENSLMTKTGGAYIPPAKLRAMQAKITDKTSIEYQRLSWEALKKSLNGLVNKVNSSNIVNVVREILGENIIRGRGLLARSILQAQSFSTTFTHVYAALVAIVNTKFPQVGELVLRRVILQFRRAYKRNDKAQCISACKFVAHLVNQQVAHELLALELLMLLLENPTDDSVELAIGLLKEVGAKLREVSPKGSAYVSDRLRSILHEAKIQKRTQYMIEVMFSIVKDGFKEYPSVSSELDLVDEGDQFTHLLTLDDQGSDERILDIFKFDPEFESNEAKYAEIRKELLGDKSSDSESGSGSDSGEESDDEEDDVPDTQVITDMTEQNLSNLRKTIYLTIQSSLNFEEAAHKLLRMSIPPGQEVELCNMLLDCCAQLRTYEKFHGLLAERFCRIDKKYVEPFEQIFKDQYDTCHRLETMKLRNVAKYFGHLLTSDAISWGVLQAIKMTEADTTSSGRIFVKILFQDLAEHMGLVKLNDRLQDETLAPLYFTGLFPTEDPRDMRFSINFFTSIGLGGLTDRLRQTLKGAEKRKRKQNAASADVLAKLTELANAASSSSSSSSDSSSDSSSSESSD